MALPRMKAIPIVLLVLLAPHLASATLGGDVSSVAADGTQMRATAAVQVRQSGPYSVHQITTARGESVREYVSAAGVVYAVAWNGQFTPDLRQLLGAHYDTMMQSTHRVTAGRARLTVTEPTLVVESIGHMRAYRGRAYLPDAIPASVSIDSIQ